MTAFHRIRVMILLAVLLCVGTIPVKGQDPATEKVPPVVAPEVPDGRLRFSFEGVPWREVIKWLADEGGLALHVSEIPPGSFTYTDPGTFTHQQAIDRVNLFLLPESYTLVRSDRLLSVINLGDPRSTQQLSALARMVTVDQLDKLPDHDVVKCIFPLEKLKAEDAVEELSPLNLMMTPIVFKKTNRLLITDTAGKLKTAKAILDSFQPSALTNGAVVKSFSLQHVNAEDVLVVARPHLGLATGEMIGIDVSLSADLQGKNIFVTGVEDKVSLIEGLVSAIDKPSADKLAASGDSVLKSHLVEGGNVETVYNVLLTLLAGKNIRLSMDEKANSVVALATPADQEVIAKTVAQLKASDASFEIIPLKTVDPYFVISLLEQMLDLPDPLLDDEVDGDAPKIDADPDNMRLFVRGKPHQIEQIKKIVAGLDVNTTTAGSEENVRLFPLKGTLAVQALETAAKFWRGENPVILFRSAATAVEETERVLTDEPKSTVTSSQPAAATELPLARLLTDNPQSKAPIIRCQLTPRGLLMQCDDTKALDQFVTHLRTVAGPADAIPSPPIVFYLKYSRASDAIRMLAELLDGGESAREGGSGSLVNAYSPLGAGSFLGSLVTSRDGTTTMTAGTITVVADARLNRLIAQGNARDMETIERYLKIIDKDNSITSIETYGTPHVIELRNTRASEVAVAIREAYAGRVTAVASSSRNLQPGQPGSQPSAQPNGQPASDNRIEQDQQNRDTDKKSNDKRTQQPRSPSQQARELEPRMTITVHEPSNSLIVTAPEQLFKEVEQLARLIDTRSQEAVRVVPLRGKLGIDPLLEQLLSEEKSIRSTRPSSSPNQRPVTSTSIRKPPVSRGGR